MPAEQDYRYSALNKQKSEIRLLRVSQDVNRSPHEPLTIQIKHVSLDERPRFDALSYTWGDPTPKHPILLNGYGHRIATNLFVALQTLGKPSVLNNPLWIDALCINQNDLDERAQQVAMMARLYQCAENVRVWLGPGGPYTAAAFQIILNPPKTSVKRAGITDDELRGIDDLVGRPWWTRLWMLQEVRGGETACAHCGDLVTEWPVLKQELLSWTTKCSGSYSVASNNDSFAQRVAGLKLPSLAGNAVLPARWRYYEDIDASRSILRILETGTNFGCADSRDHLFGLLGLMPPDIGIQPNYRIPAAEAFMLGTAKILEYEKNFDILRLAGLHHGMMSGLPSWAADLSCGSNDEDLWRIGNWAKASMGSAFFAKQMDAGQLQVRCLPVDTCLAVGRAAPPLAEQSAPEWSENWRHALRDWRALALRASTRESPRGVTTSFWNIVFGEYIDQAIKGNHAFDDWLDRVEGDPAQRPHAADELMQKSNVGTFFTTQSGRMGMCFRPTIKVGDTVAILAGSRLPVVLRRQAVAVVSKYQLISVCTCLGLMTGEAVQGPAIALVTNGMTLGSSSPITSEKIEAAKSHSASTRTAAEIEKLSRIGDPSQYDLSTWPRPVRFEFFKQAFGESNLAIGQRWPDLPDRLRLFEPSSVRTYFIDLYECLTLPDNGLFITILTPYVGSESAAILCSIVPSTERTLLCSALARHVSEAFEEESVARADREAVLTSLGFELEATTWMLQAIEGPAYTKDVRRMVELLFENVTLV